MSGDPTQAVFWSFLVAGTGNRSHKTVLVHCLRFGTRGRSGEAERRGTRRDGAREEGAVRYGTRSLLSVRKGEPGSAQQNARCGRRRRERTGRAGAGGGGGQTGDDAFIFFFSLCSHPAGIGVRQGISGPACFVPASGRSVTGRERVGGGGLGDDPCAVSSMCVSLGCIGPARRGSETAR